MTKLEPAIDFDHLAELRLRLRRMRHADAALGCEILRLVLPGTDNAAEASRWLLEPGMEMPPNLDITTSIDSASSLIERMCFGPEWTISRHGPDSATGGLHHADLAYRYLSCSGSGPTAVAALLDLALHAYASGAAAYSEEEAPALEGRPMQARPFERTDPGELPDAWSDEPVERTRQVIADFWPNLDGMDRLCLKNHDGRFGTMEGYELHHGILRVVNQGESAITRFETVDDLLAAGWVLD